MEDLFAEAVAAVESIANSSGEVEIDLEDTSAAVDAASPADSALELELELDLSDAPEAVLPPPGPEPDPEPKNQLRTFPDASPSTAAETRTTHGPTVSIASGRRRRRAASRVERSAGRVRRVGRGV